MSYSEQFFTQLTQLNAEVKQGFEKLNGLQSALDRQLADHYHDIERLDSVDGAEARELMAQLKTTLMHRRVVKDEMKKIQPVFYMLRDQVQTVETQYDKAVRTSCEIRRQLNSTMSLDEVLGAIEV